MLKIKGRKKVRKEKKRQIRERSTKETGERVEGEGKDEKGNKEKSSLLSAPQTPFQAALTPFQAALESEFPAPSFLLLHLLHSKAKNGDQHQHTLESDWALTRVRWVLSTQPAPYSSRTRTPT